MNEFPIVEFDLQANRIIIKGTTEALILLQGAIVCAIAQSTREAELLKSNADVFLVNIEKSESF